MIEIKCTEKEKQLLVDIISAPSSKCPFTQLECPELLSCEACEECVEKNIKWNICKQ